MHFLHACLGVYRHPFADRDRRVHDQCTVPSLRGRGHAIIVQDCHHRLCDEASGAAFSREFNGMQEAIVEYSFNPWGEGHSPDVTEAGGVGDMQHTVLHVAKISSSCLSRREAG